MKQSRFFNLILVFSFLLTNLGISSIDPTSTRTQEELSVIEEILDKIEEWNDSLKVVTIITGKLSDIVETPSITSSPWLGGTPTTEPSVTPALLPTEYISPTVTPVPPTNGFTLAAIEVNLEPDPAAPGDVITATWTIKNYHGQYDGVEVWLYLPEAFIPIETGEGSYDPETNLLIIPINGPDGMISWFIQGDANPPYSIPIEMHRDGQVIISVTRILGQRGPEPVSVEGGEAHGFNQHVKVNFPNRALPEAADVMVRAPRNTEQSLGGLPMELTAIGRVSGLEITEFNQPVTISVQYTEEEAQRQLDQAGMKDENSLTLFYYDETQSTWYPLDTSVDTEANILTAVTEHFSLFDYKAQNWEASRLPTLEGFQVSGFTGAGTYSYPIQVPPGPGGLQPSLELSYNSQEIDSASSRTQASWAGMGWSLDTGYIRRNMNGTPNYFDDDTFSLVMNGVGGLLLPIADQDGDPYTIDYHFADERFWRVRQYLASGDVGGYNGDHSKWVVFAPDGTQYYFGNYANGSLVGHAWYPSNPITCSQVYMQTWRWSLTRVRNIYGKETTYNYYKEQPPYPKYATGCPEGPAAGMEVAMYPSEIIYSNNRYRIEFVRNGTLRTDYDQAWNYQSSRMFFMRSMLSRIEIWHDPNGIWSSGDEILIRKYVLGYGENYQQLYPGITWPAGGKTPTLTSITEYGLNGTNYLPKTYFTYDNMHLRVKENGYGGGENVDYLEWHASNGYDSYRFDPEPIYQITGEYYPDENSVNELDLLKEYYQPGTYYKIVADVYPHDCGSFVKLGIDDGISHIYGEPLNLECWQWSTVTSIVMISEDANQARALFTCYGHCDLTKYEVFPLVTRYRVSSKTIEDEVTGVSYTTQFEYTGAAVNDTSHSAYVLADPGGYYLTTKPNSEFRGHSHITETDPDGRVVESWYNQDDIYKGKIYQTQIKDSTGNIFTQENSSYAYQEFSTYNLPHPQGQPLDFYHDLKLMWVYTTAEENRIYNGGIYYAATKNEYQYATSDQGGTQYGNRTRILSYEWSGGAWIAYRGSRSGYYPTVYNGTPENAHYLTGLPGYTKTFQCPSGCDWSVEDLVSLQWYLYDNHTMYSDTPVNGKLTGHRILTHFATDPYSDYMYADTSFTYDSWGNQTSVTQFGGETDAYGFGTGSDAQTAYTCYGGGGTFGGFTCNDDGYHTYLLWDSNALDQQTTYTYDFSKSVPLSISDPNDSPSNDTTTSATYDEFGRILTIVRPGDDINYPTTSFSYHESSGNFADNPFWTEAQLKLDNNLYFKIRKFYNGIGQLIQTQTLDATIGSQVQEILTDTFYDAGGRVYKQTVPFAGDTNGNYQERSTSVAATTTLYDVLGRPLTSWGTDSSETGYIYWTDIDMWGIPSQKSLYSNSRGFDTLTQIDNWGRIINVNPPDGPEVDYIYDAADRLVTAFRGGAITSIEYDYAGRKTSMNDPDMGIWSYEYDATGNLTSQTDARGCTTILEYDLLSRLFSKNYSGECGVSTASVSYAYDSGLNGIGHRTNMNDGSGSTSWTYDKRGRLIQEIKVIDDTESFKTMWSYNSADLVASMTYPSGNDGGTGEVVNFTYLSQMLLDTVIGSTTYIYNTDYDAAGRMDLRQSGSSGSIRQDYFYFDWEEANGAGRLQQITSGTSSNPTSLQDLRYTYDANGNVMTIQDYKDKRGKDPQQQSFTYDMLDRLSSAVAQKGSHGTYNQQYYVYNETTGNLMSKAGISYTYGDTNHKHAVTSMGSDSFSYDGNGNQITRNVGVNAYTLSYGAENRLVSVSGALTATFVYDGDGNRVKGSIGGVTTIYIGNYFEWTGSTSTMKKYYYAGSSLVAMRTGSSTLNFIFGDHLGSTAITTNSSGGKVAEIRYYPWGTERYTYGTTPTTYHFTGQRLEDDIGLYYYGARWYDPAAGRFIQADSIIPNPSISQSWDRYSYVNNNPLKYTDPSGHNAYCDNEYADPEECAGIRQGINNLDDYILFEYRSPLHETYDYRNFGAYRGKWDYGNNPDIWHVSIDAGVPRDLGMKVYPVLPGVVTKVGWEDTSLGNYIVIKHETEYGNVYSVYGHLGTEVGNGNLVKEGTVVDKNTPIGTLGNTNGMPVHLHFEIRFETNVNASEGISGMDYWAFDSSWIYDFFDLGQIYGYVDNAAQGNPPLP